ncbi:MAG: cadherin domain-containing protein, partial [Ekhidna sp.]|nr:cadherin domain-containing protein [Ekhidna sp.]
MRGGDDDKPVEIKLALAETSLSISADELEPTDIAVTASGGEWTVTSNVNWLSAENVDNKTLRVSYDKNNKAEPREGIITASIGEVSGTINVTQEGVKLELDKSSLSIPADALAPTDIAVTASGGEWTVTSNVNWLSAENVDNKTLRVSANANMTADSRKGSVTVSLGEVKKSLNVTQAGAPEDNTEQNTANTAPTIADQTFSVPEDANNGTAVGTVLASDAETNNLMFSITQGNTGDVFAIVEGTGAITVAATLDFEITQSYTLKVSVSDGSLSATADITVNVTDV